MFKPTCKTDSSSDSPGGDHRCRRRRHKKSKVILYDDNDDDDDYCQPARKKGESLYLSNDDDGDEFSKSSKWMVGAENIGNEESKNDDGNGNNGDGGDNKNDDDESTGTSSTDTETFRFPYRKDGTSAEDNEPLFEVFKYCMEPDNNGDNEDDNKNMNIGNNNNNKNDDSKKRKRSHHQKNSNNGDDGPEYEYDNNDDTMSSSPSTSSSSSSSSTSTSSSSTSTTSTSSRSSSSTSASSLSNKYCIPKKQLLEKFSYTCSFIITNLRYDLQRQLPMHRFSDKWISKLNENFISSDMMLTEGKHDETGTSSTTNATTTPPTSSKNTTDITSWFLLLCFDEKTVCHASIRTLYDINSKLFIWKYISELVDEYFHEYLVTELPKLSSFIEEKIMMTSSSSREELKLVPNANVKLCLQCQLFLARTSVYIKIQRLCMIDATEMENSDGNEEGQKNDGAAASTSSHDHDDVFNDDDGNNKISAKESIILSKKLVERCKKYLKFLEQNIATAATTTSKLTRKKKEDHRPQNKNHTLTANVPTTGTINTSNSQRSVQRSRYPYPRVAQLCPDTRVVLRVFDNVNAARKSVGTKGGKLYDMLKSGNSTEEVYHGYRWRFATVNEEEKQRFGRRGIQCPK